jgi:hypothetical protein
LLLGLFEAGKSFIFERFLLAIDCYRLLPRLCLPDLLLVYQIRSSETTSSILRDQHLRQRLRICSRIWHHATERKARLLGLEMVRSPYFSDFHFFVNRRIRIFIINGAMTIFLAILGRILIVDFPDKVHKSRRPFLNAEEVSAIQSKLDRDRQDAEYDELTTRKFMKVCGRWELWFL